MTKTAQNHLRRSRLIQPNGLLLTLAVCAMLALSAQDSLPPNKLTYTVSLREQNGQVLNGFLKQVTDSTVMISWNRTIYGAPILASDHVVPCNEIKKLKFKRSNAVGKGALVGAGVGLGTGLIAGLAVPKKAPAGGLQIISNDAAVGLLGILGALAGTLAGTVIGAIAWHTYDINGSANKLTEVRWFFDQKVYGQMPLTASQ